jgi:hypothetical protein
MCHSRWSFGQSASGLCVSGLLGHDSSTLSTCAHIESHCNCLDAVMAVSSRRSSVSKPPESVRYYYEPSRSKSKASISVSSAAKSKHESSTLDKRPRLQRSVSTSQSQSQSQSTPLDDKALDKDKDKDKKQHRRTSSFLGSIFRPSIPTPAPVSSPTPRVRTAECLTCGSDDVPVTRSAKLPCGHRMCNSCLRRIFTMSIKDPQHMPPKCCNQDHIPLKHVDHLSTTSSRSCGTQSIKSTRQRTASTAPQRAAANGSSLPTCTSSKVASTVAVRDVRRRCAHCATTNYTPAATAPRIQRPRDLSTWLKRRDGNAAIIVRLWSSSRRAATI